MHLIPEDARDGLLDDWMIGKKCNRKELADRL